MLHSFKLQSSMDENEQIESIQSIQFFTVKNEEEIPHLYVMHVTTLCEEDNDSLTVNVYNNVLRILPYGLYLKEIQTGNAFVLQDYADELYLHLFLAKYAKHNITYDDIKDIPLEEVFPTPYVFSERILDQFNLSLFLENPMKPPFIKGNEFGINIPNN